MPEPAGVVGGPGHYLNRPERLDTSVLNEIRQYPPTVDRPAAARKQASAGIRSCCIAP